MPVNNEASDLAFVVVIKEHMLTRSDMTQEQKPRLGDEAPGGKDFIRVIVVVALLIAFSWIAWFKFRWFH